MISPNTIQQILNRIDIVEIVGDFVKLKKRGTNYLGLCPFHNEKTPSFTVSPSKEIYKCFGCGRSGNAVGFLMEHEKYSYVEALKWLANKYNVEVEETGVSEEWKEQQQIADSLFIINQFAARFFHEKLLQEEDGIDIGLSYFKERGFTEDTIKKFQLGYSSQQRDQFAKAALAAHYSKEYLLRSGLVVERDGQLIDNYRGRVIFPVHNQTGKIIGFGARVLGRADKAPKYINTPENEIYVKSKILYGMYFARQAIDKADECLLVEGYTDVLSLHQAGIENVVASGGTSLTVDQLRLIHKYTRHLTILYDGDPAGVKAAMRGLDLALEEGLQVQVVLIPDNEDPDSYVKKIGPDAFREFIRDNKKDVILFQLEVMMQDAGQDSSRKSAIVNQVAETLARISKAEDFTRQQDYIKRSAALLNVDEAGLTSLVNKFIREKIQKQENKWTKEEEAKSEIKVEVSGEVIDEGLELLQKDEKNEIAMSRALLEFGHLHWQEGFTVADHILQEIEDNGLEELIDNKNLIRIIRLYEEMYKIGEVPTPKHFLYHHDPQISQWSVRLFETNYEISPNWKKHFEGPLPSREDLYREEVFSSLNYLKLRKIKRLILENQKDLEKNPDPEELMTLLRTHQHLKEIEMQLTRELGTVIFR